MLGAKLAVEWPLSIAVTPHMQRQNLLLSELSRADRAFEWFLASVFIDILLQEAWLMECHVANVALMGGIAFHRLKSHAGLILRMGAYVCQEAPFGWKFGRTCLAFSGMILAVHSPDVPLQNAVVGKSLLAQLALVGAVTCVAVKVLPELRLLSKSLLAELALERLFPSVYPHVHLQAALGGIIGLANVAV